MNVAQKQNILWAIIVVSLVAVGFVPPIPQDLEYHNFADQSVYFGIPNTWDVLSNVPFVLIGLYGLFATRKTAIDGIYRTTAIIFFIGMVLTGFGSGYYHLSPSNETLVWDRLPMTIAFMAFFSFILSVHINERVGRVVLVPLLVLGISSVFYWDYTESIDAGDLRFYAVIQFLPILLIPTIILMFPSPRYLIKYIWWIITAYVAAKLLEHFDAQVLSMLGVVSGHSLKHVAASLSGIAFLYALASMRR